MWSNLVSAALLYGVLSTTIVVAQTSNPVDRIPAGTTTVFNPANPTDGSGAGSGSEGGGGNKAWASTTGTATGIDASQGSTVSSSALSGVQETNSINTSPPETDGHNVSGGKNDASATNIGPKTSAGKNNTGAIAGGVVGGILFLVLVGALIFFFRRKKRTRDPFGSLEKSPDERAVDNESSSPLPPAPIVAASASPHHSPTTPNEAHALMSHYGDAQPQHIPQAQEVQPVIMPAKPYDVNPSSREIRDGDEDDDGVSINSPSPVTTPSPERQQEQQRSVPRLPIYQGGRKDDVSGNTPPPAL